MKRRCAGVVLAALAIACAAGCDSSAAPDRAPHSASAYPEWHQGGPPILRRLEDPARDRVWILVANGVEVYEVKSRRRLAFIDLPHWIWVHEPYACAPDLALGPHGEVLVTSNAIAVLWRVDPSNFETSSLEIAVQTTPGLEFGFTALDYSPDLDAYFGASSTDGSLWQIDPVLHNAHRVSLPTPLHRACGMVVRKGFADFGAGKVASLCVRTAKGDVIVDQGPTQRSGRVAAGFCRVGGL